MQAARNAFRSLRSFTHAARHHPASSEIVSDPIVDDDLVHTPETPKLHRNHRHPSPDHIVVDSPTPIKSRRASSAQPSSPQLLANSNHLDSSNETHLPHFQLDPQQSPQQLPSVLSPPAPTSPRRHIIKSQLDQPQQSFQLHTSSSRAQTPNHTKLPSTQPRTSPCLPRGSALPPQTPSQPPQKHHDHDRARGTSNHQPAFGPLQVPLLQVQNNPPSNNKSEPVFDLEQVVDRPESPPIKRRRTRSSTRRNRRSSPTPEVDQLLLRQLVDNATDEERKAILAASGSSRGRRKLHQLFVHDEQHHAQQGKPSVSNASKDGDVEWLGTSYDSVEEVAPTPSPQAKRKTRPHRLIRDSDVDGSQRKTRRTRVERIETSESPERIVRRRSRRLSRDINRASRRGNLDRGVETVDSSSSPGPKRRRSRRLARVAELPPVVETADSDASDHSRLSGDSVIEKFVLPKKTKRRNGTSRSRPLPRLRAGLLQERLRRRTPLSLIKKVSHEKAGRTNASHDGYGTDPDGVSLRRSKRLRNSRTRRRPVVDVDADDEVIEEGSAEDENEDAGPSFEEELIVEEIEYEEDEDYSEIQIDDGEDDEGDDDDDDDDDDSEEREWKEQLKRKQIKRKKRRNGRRKRTQPRDVFRTEGEFLTTREQKERLDFLVKQSEEIASNLHNAMGDVGSNHPEGEGDATRKEETFVPPSGKGCELQPHQKEGVDWLLTLDSQGLNAILADEMGLGKTIQAVSFLASLVLSGSRGPHLVVAPKNVCQHWADEVRKWYPTELTVVTHLGNAEDRLDKLKDVLEEDNFDILVTSFDHGLADLFTRKKRYGMSWEHVQVLRAFRKVEFEYLVVDEAHRLKNDSSKINLAIRNYGLAQRRLLLTGTPLSNNLKELWSLMNVLNPRIFSSKATFEAWFSAPFASKTKKRSKVSLTHAEQSVIVDRLHSVIRPFFRRRVRADVCPTFTSADEVVIQCPLSGLQRAVLLHLQRRATANEAGISNVIMAMRAASNHPYIVSEALFDHERALASERLIATSGKFVFLHFALPRLINSGHRVLIFSQFRRVLDFIEDLLIVLDLKFERLDGETSSVDRTNGLAEFNREGSDIPVFLLTTRAGGVGLNLQTADTVILFDSDWNPSADLQAVSRIQRIGQKRTVHILRLVTEKSVDDLIVETARHKLRTQNVAVGAGKFNTSKGAALDSRERRKDLEELLKRLEARNYAEDQEEVPPSASQENGSPESFSPRRVSSVAQTRRFEEWDKQLLRKGESALSSVATVPIWIDNPTVLSESGIPHWLSKDADLQSAAKALRCADAASADRVYEENLRMKTEDGRLNRKDRATRARRQAVVIGISDVDSENESERSNDPSVDVAILSEHDSDYEVPDDETAVEKKVRKKTKKNGLVKGWTGNQVQNAQLESTIASTPASMDPFEGASNSVHTARNGRPAKAQATLSRGRNEASGVVHLNGGTEKSSAGSAGIWGLPSPPVNASSAERQPGSAQQHFLLPTAHLKRLPPTNHVSSDTHRTVSQTARKRRGATVVRNGAPIGGMRKQRQPAACADPQPDELRTGSFCLSSAPPGAIRPAFRLPWVPVTTSTYNHMQQTASMSVPPQSLRHVGLSANASGEAVPVFGQHAVATTLPLGSRWSPYVNNGSDSLPGSGFPCMQETGITQDKSATCPSANLSGQPPFAMRPSTAKRTSRTKTRKARLITDPARPQMPTPKNVGRPPPVVVSPEAPELASSSEDFWFVANGISTEETVSVRPAASKRARSERKDSKKEVGFSNHTKHSSMSAANLRNQKIISETVKDGSPANAGTAAETSAKPAGAARFAAQVERLREVTKVLDTEFLEDALLDCDCNIEAAREMVLRQVK